MGLSAEDVHGKQFKLVRNSTGYDMEEVDAFLDEVEAEIARLDSELEQAVAAVAAPESDTTPAAAARMLAMAQHTADEYVADARRRADSMVADAEKAARKSVKKLESQRAELEGRVSALLTFESEVRARLTGYFQSQLADLGALVQDHDE